MVDIKGAGDEWTRLGRQYAVFSAAGLEIAAAPDDDLLEKPFVVHGCEECDGLVVERVRALEEIGRDSAIKAWEPAERFSLGDYSQGAGCEDKDADSPLPTFE